MSSYDPITNAAALVMVQSCFGQMDGWRRIQWFSANHPFLRKKEDRGTWP
jgi:hypothetical protein